MKRDKRNVRNIRDAQMREEECDGRVENVKEPNEEGVNLMIADYNVGSPWKAGTSPGQFTTLPASQFRDSESAPFDT
ncbi:hypothetical protein N7523_002385 [Penicillium sp. IBT 18751x]|nr:hypothetical protein N7523_002385 [Penicillium sp. IBT 18751x]